MSWVVSWLLVASCFGWLVGWWVVAFLTLGFVQLVGVLVVSYPVSTAGHVGVDLV